MICLSHIHTHTCAHTLAYMRKNAAMRTHAHGIHVLCTVLSTLTTSRLTAPSTTYTLNPKTVNPKP